MKEVKAFVRPDRMEVIYNALRTAGYRCMTLTHGEGTGNFTVPRKKMVKAPRHPFMHVEVVKIEIICTPDEVENIVRIIHENGKTEYSGDGIIMVRNLEKVYSVKDGTSGEKVLNP